MSNINGKSDVTPTESKTTSTVGHVPHGSRETPATSVSPMNDGNKGVGSLCFTTGRVAYPGKETVPEPFRGAAGDCEAPLLI